MMKNHKENSCPYAVSLSDEEDNASTHDLVEVAMHSCPAFAAGSCPFRDAKNADDVRHALLQVPPSHLQDEKGHFYRALRHLHHVSQTTNGSNDDKFAIVGGCPVQTYSPDMSFVQAMEERSLASIMARMAQDVMDKEEEESPHDDVQMPASVEQPVMEASIAPPKEASSSHQDDGGVTLSQALKSGTAASHQAAEEVHFVRNFIKGKIERTLYAELVLSLYHVYVAMEEALDQHAPQHFASCHFPKELSRTEALEEDVDFWHGPNHQAMMSPATRDYVNRLEYIASTDPLLLLAHAYTRYLGDLSGGKILARVARRAMNLSTGGLDFYEFQHVPSAKLFKDDYRKALDDLPLTEQQISNLVAEANVAFVLNMRLFEELDVQANIPGARVRPLQEALEYANPPQDNNNETAASSKCPFATMSKNESTTTDTPSQCPFARMSAGVKSLVTNRFPLVLGLAACLLWSHMMQRFHDEEAVMASSPPKDVSAVLLLPFQAEWDLDGPWM